MDCYKLPKVELHLHLDRSLTYSVVSRLNPAITHAEYLESFNSPAGAPVLGDILSDARRISFNDANRRKHFAWSHWICLSSQRDNMLYAEIRFAPLLHTEKGLSAEDVWRRS